MRKNKTQIFLPALILMGAIFANCGSAKFDDPPNIAGSYQKVSDICTDSFFKMPSTIDVEQIGAEIEIEPGVGPDLEGTIDNNGNIRVEDPDEGVECRGDYEENDEQVTLECEFEDIDCSAIYILEDFDSPVID